MRVFVARHPLAFSLLLTLALFGLVCVSRAALPVYVISSVADLPPEALKKPTAWEQVISDLKVSENLFRVLTILLAALLLTALGWWREAGFNRPSQWRNLHLLSLPLLVGALAFLGGVELVGPALLLPALLGLLVTVFSEEVVYRGILWRALAPTGVVRAVVTTLLLSGVLNLVALGSSRPWPEAVYLTILVTCAGFTYGALRWRTASIWPVMLLHFVLSAIGEISTPETVPYLVTLLIFALTLGFVGYGLFLLRDSRVRADGGLTAPVPLRVK